MTECSALMLTILLLFRDSFKILSRIELQIPSSIEDDSICDIKWAPTTTTTGENAGSLENLPDLMIRTSKNVHILNLNSSDSDKSATNDSESEKSVLDVSETFCHDGHKSDVLNSVSHPDFRTLFFSSDIRNNLHAWSYNN